MRGSTSTPTTTAPDSAVTVQPTGRGRLDLRGLDTRAVLDALDATTLLPAGVLVEVEVDRRTATGPSVTAMLTDIGPRLRWVVVADASGTSGCRALATWVRLLRATVVGER